MEMRLLLIRMKYLCYNDLQDRKKMRRLVWKKEMVTVLCILACLWTQNINSQWKRNNQVECRESKQIWSVRERKRRNAWERVKHKISKETINRFMYIVFNVSSWLTTSWWLAHEPSWAELYLIHIRLVFKPSHISWLRFDLSPSETNLS